VLARIDAASARQAGTNITNLSADALIADLMRSRVRD
jgi:hypothetical protein